MNQLVDGVSGQASRRVRVACGTCGHVMWLAPSVAESRLYCNRTCFENRESGTLAGNIMKAIGGTGEIAATLRLPIPTVRHWATQGIPLKYHMSIIRIAKEKGLGKNMITLDKLLATTVAGRELRSSKKL